jgi:hypothetical protein
MVSRISQHTENSLQFIQKHEEYIFSGTGM